MRGDKPLNSEAARSSYDLTIEQIERSVDPRSRPDRVVVGGEQFVLHSNVVSPAAFPSTQIFAEHLPYPIGGTFLEMGCGAGVATVVGAKRGCSRVVAIDINPDAVANTQANVRLHDLERVVTVLEGDMFQPLSAHDRFDLIFWNSNFVLVPADYLFRSMHERGFFDPGYGAHRRYLKNGRAHLASDGRLLLGFSDLGDSRRLHGLCHQYGYRPRVLHEEPADEQRSVLYQLLEFERVH